MILQYIYSDKRNAYIFCTLGVKLDSISLRSERLHLHFVTSSAPMLIYAAHQSLHVIKPQSTLTRVRTASHQPVCQSESTTMARTASGTNGRSRTERRRFQTFSEI